MLVQDGGWIRKQNGSWVTLRIYSWRDEFQEGLWLAGWLKGKISYVEYWVAHLFPVETLKLFLTWFNFICRFAIFLLSFRPYLLCFIYLSNILTSTSFACLTTVNLLAFSFTQVTLNNMSDRKMRVWWNFDELFSYLKVFYVKPPFSHTRFLLLPTRKFVLLISKKNDLRKARSFNSPLCKK